MSGSIKIGAPRTLFYQFIHDKLLEFQSKNPEVIFDITLSSQMSMDKFGQCDLTISKDIDNFRDLTLKPFCETPFVLCASPSYTIGDLSCPEDLLSEHIKCITVKGYEKWNFVSEDASGVKIIKPYHYISTDEENLAKYYAIGGKGVALLPKPFIEKDLFVNKLRSLNVTSWKPKNISHYLLYAHFQDIPLKCKELISFLTKNGIVKF
ncbi:LysR substrate-binding domain-containing protein [Enterobacter bugandensis]|uniref:LysR substrate-binding domain-containing protein n=1 Tax=Enterobacter bugandensis TaxID=881260 RepID=UPI0006686FFE|nr:LysR substrate-binding domain-containing protein [Enterobacter bugandensis]